MSRIEIPIEDYNGFKERIKALEKTISDISKEASEYKEKLSDIKLLVMDLEKEGLLNRIFSWKNIIKQFKDLLI